MNIRWKEYPVFLQVLLGCLLFLFLLTITYFLSLLQPFGSGLELFARANSTRTAIALTSQALYGPFPTATGPTPTPSHTPSITPSPTVTPTNTPTRTPIRYFINTGTPRTLVPHNDLTSTVPSFGSTSTSIPPTSPPRQPTATQPPPQATNPPQPTNQPPQATRPPKKDTKTPKPPKPPKPTKTPKK